MPEDLLSVTEAAEELNVHRTRIHQLIESGELQAQKIGHVYVIRRSDLKKINPRPVGRPRTKTRKAD